jgi:hypothetical protein
MSLRLQWGTHISNKSSTESQIDLISIQDYSNHINSCPKIKNIMKIIEFKPVTSIKTFWKSREIFNFELSQIVIT